MMNYRDNNPDLLEAAKREAIRDRSYQFDRRLTVCQECQLERDCPSGYEVDTLWHCVDHKRLVERTYLRRLT